MVYPVQCAVAAAPQDHAHARVRSVPQLYGPGHQVEQLRAASTPPVQKCPAASVSLFLPFCLKGKIPFVTYDKYIQRDFFDTKHLHVVSVNLVVFCSPPAPRVHPDPL